MHPHDTALEGTAPPGLDVFAAAMRSVLRTRHDSTGDGPEALETWDRVDGYGWRWTTEAGQWQITAGAVMDPRPLLHGPGGIWRVDVDPEHAVDVVLLMLRAAGALPAADLVAASPRLVTFRRPSVLIRGPRFNVVPQPVEPARAVLYRPGDPVPEPRPRYMAVRTVNDQPDGDGCWEVLLPDGYHRHRYDPARRCLVPFDPGAGGRAFLLFDAGQQPGEPHPVREDVAA